jgi:hypothetical protein
VEFVERDEGGFGVRLKQPNAAPTARQMPSAGRNGH